MSSSLGERGREKGGREGECRSRRGPGPARHTRGVHSLIPDSLPSSRPFPAWNIAPKRPQRDVRRRAGRCWRLESTFRPASDASDRRNRPAVASSVLSLAQSGRFMPLRRRRGVLRVRDFVSRAASAFWAFVVSARLTRDDGLKGWFWRLSGGWVAEILPLDLTYGPAPNLGY